LTYTSVAQGHGEPSTSSYKLTSNNFRQLPVYSATYNANNPTEDRMISDKMIKDIQCVAIFDGHGGWQVSEFASQTIFQHLEQNILSQLSNSNKDKISTDISKVSINDKIFEEANIKSVLQKTFQDVESSYIMYAISSIIDICFAVFIKRNISLSFFLVIAKRGKHLEWALEKLPKVKSFNIQ
jgi:serine/threonine protein phosphatase PrpC